MRFPCVKNVIYSQVNWLKKKFAQSVRQPINFHESFILLAYSLLERQHINVLYEGNFHAKYCTGLARSGQLF